MNTPVHKTGASPAPTKQRGCTPVAKGTWMLAVGVLLVIVSIVYGAAIPPVVTNTIQDGVVNCKDSDVRKDAFTDRYGDCDDCTPYYYALSMFNVTNAMEYLEKGAKLQVQEVGPYVYRRREIRVEVQLSSDASRVQYKTYTYHKYVADKSCKTCLETDQVISWDVGYLNVISQAGGEVGFVTSLLNGTLWASTVTSEQMGAIVRANGSRIMRWVNGLNSNEPTAWKAIGDTVMPFLSSSASAIDSLALEGFAYNGLFVRRPISQWALGYPSLLAGLALASNYVSNCQGDLEKKCASCTGDACHAIYADCKKCATGKSVVDVNNVTCAQIEATYAAAYGKEEAAKFVGNTCKTFCSVVGLCAAPLPGAAEDSGLDFSVTPPPFETLGVYTQRTGCDDRSKIGEYEQYNGFTTQPMWAKLDARRNPTLAEMNAFQIYGNCANRTPNMTCTDVYGQDGTSLKPRGAKLTGFPGEVDIAQVQMYLIQAKQNLTLVNTGEVVHDVGGIKMSRFIPPDDTLTLAPWNDGKGIGYPVDGVQSQAFNAGFLAYVSHPLFLYGNDSLLSGVEVTMADGKVASSAVLYDAPGKLKTEYYAKYHTFVDVEPGTGKTMRAVKRLQASYAVAYSQFTKGAPMTDLVWPKLQAEVISPAYIGEESALVKAKDIRSFQTIKRVLASLLPVLIGGLVLGLALAGYGLVVRRRAVADRKGALGAAV